MVGTSVLKMELIKGVAKEEDRAWRDMVEAKRMVEKTQIHFEMMEDKWVAAKYHEKYIQSCVKELGW